MATEGSTRYRFKSPNVVLTPLGLNPHQKVHTANPDDIETAGIEPRGTVLNGVGPNSGIEPDGIALCRANS